MHHRADGFGSHGQRFRHHRKGVWTPLSIGLMVLGFIVYWPLGLAVLAYNIWAQPGDFERWFHRLVTPKIAAARRSDNEFAVAWRRLETDVRSLFHELREGWRRWSRKRKT
jgi:hypothetical protein